MDFDAAALTWMHSPTRQPAVTLTSDLQNLVTPLVGASDNIIKIVQGTHEISW